MATSEENLGMLVEMGFTREQAERALKATVDLGSTVEAAINWLEQHGNAEASAGSGEKASASASGAESSEAASASSIKCDDCGKLFRTQEDAVFHAEKTKHEKFSESTENVRALTDEEKKVRALRLEERFNEARKKKEMEDEQASLNAEISRRLAAKNLQEFKKKAEDDELKRLAEERRREKEADIAAKAKILAQIEADRRDRAIRAGKLSAEAASTTTTSQSAAKPAAATSAAPKPAHDTARLQVRLPNGETLQHTFASKEQLAAVRLFVEVQRSDFPNFAAQYTFMTTFPKKVFSEAEMEVPLDALGLVPSASLTVCRKAA